MSIRFLIATLNFSFNLLNALLNRTCVQFWTLSHPTPPPPTRPRCWKARGSIPPLPLLSHDITAPDQVRFQPRMAWGDSNWRRETRGCCGEAVGADTAAKPSALVFPTLTGLGETFFFFPHLSNGTLLLTNNSFWFFAGHSPFYCFHLRAKAIPVSFFWWSRLPHCRMLTPAS